MEEIKKWKITRNERCMDKDGWLSLVGLHWLSVGWLTTDSNGF